ncbi:MAG: polyphosphate polymerase domain-containing protein [Bacteroidales bacterium]|nr:polyphosphate polymerase domain-containing protein [Bacteroidales bacterium]
MLVLFPKLISHDWRFEYKYRLTYQQYHRVRSAILPYMKRDQYTLASPLKRYLVRSLYFDSHNLKNYEEKVNGDSDRVKLRIRSYSDTFTKGTRLRTELKARKGIATEKHNSWIEYNTYQKFMSTWHWPDQTDVVLAEFERYIHLKTMRPKIIVEYLREGYYTRSRENIRVTFDHQVRSAHASSLFPEIPFFRMHHPGLLVLEIKCTKTQPTWLKRLVQQQGLRVTPNSKYVQGVEVARSDIVRASWSY